MRAWLLRPTLSLLATVLVISGCGGSVEEDNSKVIAQVGSETITGDQLTAVLLRSPQSPDRVLATGMISMWTDLAMVMAAVDQRVDLTADSVLDAISTPEMMERAIRAYATKRGIDGVAPSAAQVDSLMRGNQVRAFRIHRFAVDLQDDSLKSARADVLFDIYSGTINNQTVAQATASQPAMAVRDLIVDTPPALSYDEIPPELARVIWRLGEGETSRPIAGNEGLQLFERLRNATATEALAAWLKPRLQQQADTRFVDSLIATVNLEVTDDAIQRLRSGMNEPIEVSGDEPIVTWSGGDTSPAEARMWLSYLLPAERARMADASEASLDEAARVMAHREILFGLAVAAGVADTAALRSAVKADYAAAIPALWDGAAARAGADGQPMGMAVSMMMAITEGGRPYQRLPGTLAGWLRDHFSSTFDAQAMDLAGQSAVRLWQGPGGAAVDGTAP
jgi:hypothetical protein